MSESKDSHRKSIANWYAWGAADYGVAVRIGVWEFGDAYAEYGRRYDERERGGFKALQDCFRNWQSTGLIDLDPDQLERAFQENELRDIDALLKPMSEQ